MITSFKKVDRLELFDISYISRVQVFCTWIFYKIIRDDFEICVNNIAKKVHTSAVTVSFQPYYIFIVHR